MIIQITTRALRTFFSVPNNGSSSQKGIFAYGDDKYLRQLESEVPVYYYGVSEEDDIQARNIQRTTEGSSFDVYHKDDFVGHFVLPAFGHHNIMNALGVIAVAYFEKLDMQKSQKKC